MAKQNGETGTDLATVEDKLAAAQAMVVAGSPKVLGAAFQDMIIEDMVKLEVGQVLRGIFLGPGGSVEVTDPGTGEIKPMGCWRIQHPVNAQIVALLLDSAKLRRFFTSIPRGSVVTVAKRGQVKSSRGRPVNDYILGHVPPSAIDTTAVPV